MTLEKKRTRIGYIDICKGILIVLLVWHHYMSATKRLQIESPFFYLVKDWQFIFTAFFMPAFFLVSGFCSNLKKEPKSFAKSLIRQIVIPAIFFEFLRQLFDSIFYHDPSRILLHYRYDRALFETTLWFLWALFWGKIICRLLFNYVHRTSLILLLLFLLLVSGFVLHHLGLTFNPCNFFEGLVASFYIGIGQIFKTHRGEFEKLKRYSLVAYPLALIVLKVLHIGIPALTAGMGVSMKVLPIHIFLAISGTLCLLRICEFIKRQDFLQSVGKNTLAIYGIHFLFLQLAMRLVNDYVATPDTFIGFTVFTILSYFVVAILIPPTVWCFNKRPLSWIIGK